MRLSLSFVIGSLIMTNQLSLFAVEEEPKTPPSVVLVKEAPSFTLQVPKEQQKIIGELITIMGTHSTISLGFKKSHLEGLGKELRGVGPLQFLAYVFSEPTLAKHMCSIKASSFKWNGFIKGFIPSLKREYANRNLLNDLPGFAAFLSIPYDRLEKVAKEENWNEFVSILVDSKK